MCHGLPHKSLSHIKSSILKVLTEICDVRIFKKRISTALKHRAK